MSIELILYVMAVKKNSDGDITNLMFFAKEEILNPTIFYIQSKDEVIAKINKNFKFKTSYVENGCIKEGADIIVINGYLRTESNSKIKDNLDDLPIIKELNE